MNAIELKNVTKNYNDFTLSDISLTLPKGYILGLVGENGAGKSTLIKLLLNAVKKDSGEINIMGQSAESNRFCEIKNKIGTVLEECCFSECLNLKQVNSVLKSIYKEHDEKMFFELAQKFSLPEKKKIGEYSKGMKMKLMLACALSHNPELLILDEATSGLDPFIRNEITDMLYDFTRDENHSVLISSHITSDLEKLCDYIAFLHKGKLVLCEEKDSLAEKYGIIKCKKDDIISIPRSAVIATNITDYYAEVLVKKADVTGFSFERSTLEEIIILFTKQEENVQ